MSDQPIPATAQEVTGGRVSAFEPGTEAQDVQASPEPAQARTALRERLDVAIRPVMLLGLQDAELDGAGGTQRINEWADWIVKTALAARDDELAQLRAQVAKWEAASTEWAVRAQHAETRLAEARRFCQLVAEGSCRVQAAQQARDTLAVLDGATLRVIDAAPTPEAGDA